MRFNSKARSQFYSELAKYTRAGFGIDKACESLVEQRGIGEAKRSLCRALIGGLKAGKTIAGSLRDSRGGPDISEMEVSLIDAAEQGGVLEIGFQHLAEHFRQEYEAQRRIRKSLVYPVILLHLALVVGIGITALLNNVRPNAEPGTAMDSVKTGLVWVGACYALAVVAVVFFRGLAQKAATSRSADALFRRIPLFGAVRRNQALARFCKVFQIGLLSGLKMSDAWSGAGKASLSGLIRHAALSGASRLAGGESLGSVVQDSGGAFPSDLARSLASADETGQLDRDAAYWSDFYRDATRESLEKLAEWAPRIFYWFVLGIAGWMVIRVALSYRDLLEGFLDIGATF